MLSRSERHFLRAAEPFPLPTPFGLKLSSVLKSVSQIVGQLFCIVPRNGASLPKKHIKAKLHNVIELLSTVFNHCPPLHFKISIVELEKSQRQQELMQLKSYTPSDESLSVQLRNKNHLSRDPEADHSRFQLELECSKFPMPHINGMSPELSMNGHATPYEIHNTFSRPSSKQNTPQYTTSHLDQEIVPCTPNHSSRQKADKMTSLSLPDYTRFSPAKIALRRHLNQDHAVNGKATTNEIQR